MNDELDEEMIKLLNEKAKKLDCLTDMSGVLPDQYVWNLVYVDLQRNG